MVNVLIVSSEPRLVDAIRANLAADAAVRVALDAEAAQSQLFQINFHLVFIDFESLRNETFETFVTIDNILTKERSEATLMVRKRSETALRFAERLTSLRRIVDLSRGRQHFDDTVRILHSKANDAQRSFLDDPASSSDRLAWREVDLPLVRRAVLVAAGTAAITSAFVIRPPVPVPLTADRSIPCSSAYRCPPSKRPSISAANSPLGANNAQPAPRQARRADPGSRVRRRPARPTAAACPCPTPAWPVPPTRSGGPPTRPRRDRRHRRPRSRGRGGGRWRRDSGGGHAGVSAGALVRCACGPARGDARDRVLREDRSRRPVLRLPEHETEHPAPVHQSTRHGLRRLGGSRRGDDLGRRVGVAGLVGRGLPGDEEHFAHPAGGDVCTSVRLRPALWRSRGRWPGSACSSRRTAISSRPS